MKLEHGFEIFKVDEHTKQGLAPMADVKSDIENVLYGPKMQPKSPRLPDAAAPRGFPASQTWLYRHRRRARHGNKMARSRRSQTGNRAEGQRRTENPYEASLVDDPCSRHVH